MESYDIEQGKAQMLTCLWKVFESAGILRCDIIGGPQDGSDHV